MKRNLSGTLRLSMVTSVALVAIKLVGGVIGTSYALIADAIESSLDIFSTLLVWGAVIVSQRPPDEEHPYGYGKAEALATIVVALTLLGAAVGISIAAIFEILTPHRAPAPFTLFIVGGVAIAKEMLSRAIIRTADEEGSMAVRADGWHHRSDAITSAAAFAGIAAALAGGPGWESADDWAALLAGFIIARNGFILLTPAYRELMDKMPDERIVEAMADAAKGVPGVLAIEKLRVRTAGPGYMVDLHVQADPLLPLRDAHILGGKVKTALRRRVPETLDVLVHMEPFESSTELSATP